MNRIGLKAISIKLKSIEDDDRPVYIVGDFNDWNPRHPAFQMIYDAVNANYVKTVYVPTDGRTSVAFKFTKGGWENGEIDIYGNITPNRVVNINVPETEQVVQRWRRNWAPFKKEYFPIVEVVSEAFFMPQLGRTRKVWALLPYDYHSADKRYEVLYLHDAQNLFNDGSEFGNWEIDRKLGILAEYGRGDVIVVAVEHGDDSRISEYIFEKNRLVAQGEGKKLLRFVTDTLKPYIDTKYRTLPERENTGIGGSSLGALISIYGGFLYPEVYSKLMIFSPSLWAVPEIEFPMIRFFNPFNTKLYIYGGEKEGSRMVEYIDAFVEKMKKQTEDSHVHLEFKVSINPEGEHNEFYWSQEFPRALEWLYYDSPLDASVIQRTKIKQKMV